MAEDTGPEPAARKAAKPAKPKAKRGIWCVPRMVVDGIDRPKGSHQMARTARHVYFLTEAEDGGAVGQLPRARFVGSHISDGTPAERELLTNRAGAPKILLAGDDPQDIL